MSATNLTKDDVLKTKELLRSEKNWITGIPIMVDGEACYCLGGALAKVLTGDPRDVYASDDEVPAFRQFYERAFAIQERTKEVYGPNYVVHEAGPMIYYWNDHPSRNFGQVIELLDSVAATFEE